MKFTKEQLSETLGAKLTNNGKKPLSMSKRSFNGKIERLFKRLEKLVNNDDLELANVVDDNFEDFLEDDNNARDDRSKFIKDWELSHKQNPLGNTIDDKPNQGNTSEDKIDLLLKEIQGLKEEREQEKKVKTISAKRSQLKSLLKGKNIKNEDWINDQLELIHVDVDTNIETLTDRLVQNYNKFSANTPPNITPTQAGSGAEKAIDADDVVAIVKKQSHRQ